MLELIGEKRASYILPSFFAAFVIKINVKEKTSVYSMF